MQSLWLTVQSSEGKASDYEEMPGVHCDQEEEANHNTATQAMLLDDTLQAESKDGLSPAKVSQNSNCC